MKTLYRPDLAANFVTNAAKAQTRPHPYDPKSAGITTLIDCLFKKYLQRTGQMMGEEDPLSLMKPMLGTNSHAVFCKGGIEADKYVQAEQYGLKINGYIDLIEEASDSESGSNIAVGELKNTWAKYYDKPNAHYIDQVAFYCACMGTLEGRIYVINIIPAKCHCYQIFFEQTELDWYMKELWSRALLLNHYVEHEEDKADAADALLPYHESWMCRYCSAKGTLCEAPTGKDKAWFEDKVPEEDD